MRFYIHKLGCPKNDVDADYLTSRLIADGHKLVATPEDADSVLVNTCGFILPAKEESIHELLRLCRFKGPGQVSTVYAVGCLSQRHGDELLKGIPELDGAFGIGELDAIARAVAHNEKFTNCLMTDSGQLCYIDWKTRYVDDSTPYAYLKISDGCDRRCAYCSIPNIRGDYRSRSVESILNEAEYLADRGKKELILVSQDATYYGHDIGRDLLTLLRQLEQISSISWIRLLYLHPAGLTRELIEYMTVGNKALPYFDVPLQHISCDILSAMGRRVDKPAIQQLIDTIRAASDQTTIRTTFIVGLPGETEAHFQELFDFVVANEFDRMGVFSYSPEEGTRAAEMPNHVKTEVRYHRMDQLMTAQQDIAFAKNNSLIGQRRDVIIDAIQEDGSALGRTWADCPEIDQEIFVKGVQLQIGRIYQVEITASKGYDLEGTVVEG
ncbi:MAG: 30S ribosomal protein S12 methylthiotransferase RimO [Candidatus Zixiibacteriota bacterium]|nr:MAG: 30S ribosomal protein S12 methylthiotransferase RimO [candidate division Zixibacteria bacterium]